MFLLMRCAPKSDQHHNAYDVITNQDEDLNDIEHRRSQSEEREEQRTMQGQQQKHDEELAHAMER